MGYLDHIRVAQPGQTCAEALFLFEKSHTRAKILSFLIQGEYTFRVEGDHVLRVYAPSAELPQMISQVGELLTAYELGKTKFAAVDEHSSFAGWEPFGIQTLYQVIASAMACDGAQASAAA
jgi:hypothetical protein